MRCLCECGTKRAVRLNHLTGGATKSCGCVASEVTAARNRTHGKTHTAIYRVWFDIRRRCHDPRVEGYKWYGGRGVRMHRPWHTFEVFDRYITRYLGERPEGGSVDRIDTLKGYQPGNIRWATAKEQARNTRRTLWVEWEGRKMALAEWAERMDFNYKTTWARYNKGMGLSEIVEAES